MRLNYSANEINTLIHKEQNIKILTEKIKINFTLMNLFNNGYTFGLLNKQKRFFFLNLFFSWICIKQKL